MRHRPPHTRIPAAPAVLLLLLAAGSCELVGGYMAGPPEEQLAEAAVEQLAPPGGAFLEGRFRPDTVGTVTSTGERFWDVTVPEADETWILHITRVEVLPVQDGDDFIRWINNRARELGYRTFVPPEAVEAVRSGRVRAVGDVALEYGRAGESGRNTMERVAYLEAGAEGDDPAWRLQPEIRSPLVLRDALKTVYDDMTYTDDRVLDCMGAASPASVPRSTQLACVGEVLEQEYGDGGP